MSAANVNFTVDVPTYYSLTGSSTAASRDGSFGLYNGSAQITNGNPSGAPLSNGQYTLSATGILQPGNAYALTGDFAFDVGELKGYSGYPEGFDVKLAATALTRGSSAPPRRPPAAGFYYAGTLYAGTGNVAAQIAGAPSGTLTVTNDLYVSAGPCRRQLPAGRTGRSGHFRPAPTPATRPKDGRCPSAAIPSPVRPR